MQEEKTDNIYRIARISAGYTQIKASMLLNISEDTLSSYETGRRRVPDDIAVKMSEVYDFKLLCYQHIKQKEAAHLLPHIEQKTLCQSAIGFIKAVREANECTDILLQIAYDNKISVEEEETWKSFLETVDALEEACLTIKFCKEK